MPQPPYKRPGAGEPPVSQQTARLMSDLERLSYIHAAGDVTVAEGGMERQLQDYTPRRVYARISGAPGGAGADYPWTGVDESSSTLADLTATVYPLSGTAASMPFREINGSTSVATGTKVRGDLSADGTCYLFDHSASAAGSAFYILLTDIFIPGTTDDAAHCYNATTDSGQFYTYSWKMQTDSDGPPAITYSDGSGSGSIPASGTPCSWPAFHVRNELIPVMRASGLITDVTHCPSGASLGYTFTLTGLTGTGAELNGLEWTLQYQGGGVWTASQTTASGTCTATLTVTGAGAATLSFSGGAGNGLTYTLNPWPCTGNVTMNVGTNPYTAPATLTLTALTTAALTAVDPLCVVRAWKGAGNYLLFDQEPWIDLFKTTATTDPNGTQANFRYFDQSIPTSGDGHGGTWQNGREVRFITAE